jgi:hypothetical protein
MATQVGIKQSLRHFIHGQTQGCVRQRGFTHPSIEMTGFENSAHFNTVSLSGIENNASCKPLLLHKPGYPPPAQAWGQTKAA